MTRLGFKFENIKLAFDIYNFDTIDKAISILTRDPETNLFNHKFISSKETEKENNLNDNNNINNNYNQNDNNNQFDMQIQMQMSIKRSKK